ncbi:MAG: hypothetical protein R2706_02895 [Acidimicrobiales bacterium]
MPSLLHNDLRLRFSPPALPHRATRQHRRVPAHFWSPSLGRIDPVVPGAGTAHRACATGVSHQAVALQNMGGMLALIIGAATGAAHPKSSVSPHRCGS